MGCNIYVEMNDEEVQHYAGERSAEIKSELLINEEDLTEILSLQAELE